MAETTKRSALYRVREAAAKKGVRTTVRRARTSRAETKPLDDEPEG